MYSQQSFNELILKGNLDLDSFSLEYSQEKEQIRLNSLVCSVQDNLKTCGSFVKREWFCKHCEKENHELALLRVDKTTRLDCQIRYCSNPNCTSTRFARIKTVLDSSKRLNKLNGMFHFTIGFDKIDIKDFSKAVKEQRRNINSYFAKLRKKGINFNGFQVLDISKGRNTGDWDGKYYIHYHIITIPWNSKEVRSNMILMKQVEKEMKIKQKKKFPFFVKIHGIKNKDALFSYLSIRAVGLYKPYDTKEKNYNRVAKRLVESISDNKFMFLNEIISIEQYCSMFYKKRMFSIIGKEIVLQGSIILDNIVCKYPTECKIHGKLERKDVRMLMVFVQNEPEPPDTVINEKMQVETISPYSFGGGL